MRINPITPETIIEGARQNYNKKHPFCKISEPATVTGQELAKKVQRQTLWEDVIKKVARKMKWKKLI